MVRNQFTAAIQFFNNRLRRKFVIMLVAYLVILVLGAVAGTYSGKSGALGNASGYVDETAKVGGSEEDSDVEESNLSTTIGYILHNGESDLIIIGLGIIPFVFASVWFSIFTSVMSGASMGIAGASTGMNTALLILGGMVPHGIFEFPAICLSTVTGIYLCSVITRKILGKETDTIGVAIINVLRTFLCLILPLTILAAIVEGNLTSMVMDLLWTKALL